MLDRADFALIEMVNEGVYSETEFAFGVENGFAAAGAIWYGDTSLNTLEEDPEIG